MCPLVVTLAMGHHYTSVGGLSDSTRDDHKWQDSFGEVSLPCEDTRSVLLHADSSKRDHMISRQDQVPVGDNTTSIAGCSVFETERNKKGQYHKNICVEIFESLGCFLCIFFSFKLPFKYQLMKSLLPWVTFSY